MRINVKKSNGSFRLYERPSRIWWTLVLWFLACLVAGFIIGHYIISPVGALGFNKADCIFPARATAVACQDQPCDFQSAVNGGSGECASEWPADGQFQPAAPAQNGTILNQASKYQFQGR